MQNPAHLYISQFCPTSPTITTPLREFVAAFRAWLARFAPQSLREWTAARVAAELTRLNLTITHDGHRTVIKGIKPA